MTNPTEPRREHPSTYFVQDRSNEEELNRLRVQDQLLTIGMGGVLPEQPDPSIFHRVLDVGCGSGSWVIEAAQVYPNMSLFGIDISVRMLDYARYQAVEKGLADRIEFRMMDALRMLEFPTNYFDLVNLRMSVSWMRKWDWPKMLNELQRVTSAGGVVRITEPHIVHQTNSPALTQLLEIAQCAFFQSGHLFEPESTGLTAHLVPLLTQHGIQNVQSRASVSEYRAGTAHGQAYYEDIVHGMKTVRPFLQKWGCFPEGYDAIYQQALKEMQQSDFRVTWPLLTVWGQPSP